jgi:hypothetical protein
MEGARNRQRGNGKCVENCFRKTLKGRIHLQDESKMRG